jgi:hypothetical protein
VRVAELQSPAGCIWLLAGGWLLLSLFVHQNGALDYAAVGVMAVVAIYMMIYRKVYPTSYLVSDEAPQPGRLFRGTIETPLKSDPDSGVTIQLGLFDRRGRNPRTVWASEQSAHPMHGAQGLVVPFEFAVPADVAREINVRCFWMVTARAKIRPISWRARFRITSPSPSAPTTP